MNSLAVCVIAALSAPGFSAPVAPPVPVARAVSSVGQEILANPDGSATISEPTAAFNGSLFAVSLLSSDRGGVCSRYGHSKFHAIGPMPYWRNAAIVDSSGEVVGLRYTTLRISLIVCSGGPVRRVSAADRAESVADNGDGTFTVRKPYAAGTAGERIVLNAALSDRDGLCRHLGYKSTLSVYTGRSEGRYAAVGRDGRITAFDLRANEAVESLTCR